MTQPVVPPFEPGPVVPPGVRTWVHCPSCGDMRPLNGGCPTCAYAPLRVIKAQGAPECHRCHDDQQGPWLLDDQGRWLCEVCDEAAA